MSDVPSELKNLSSDGVWIKSSGSTAEPKWISLSREALDASAAAVNRHLKVTAQDIWLNVLPTTHVGGLGVWWRAKQAQIPCIDFSLRKWSAAEFVDDLVRFQVTLSALVPTQVYDLVNSRSRAPATLRAIIVGGGALDPELYLSARDLGWPLLPSYGLTECASQVATASLNSLGEMKFPTLQILDHVEVTTADDEVLKIKSNALLSGMAFQENAHWKFFDPKVDGWFTTQDCVRLEGNSLIHLGRRDFRIKILGELVDMTSLEGKLSAANSDDLEVLLMPVPDDRWGHKLQLVATGRLAQAEQLMKRFNESVSRLEQISHLYTVRNIPRSPLGKPLFPQLKAQLFQQ